MDKPKQYNKYIIGKPRKFYICDRQKCNHCPDACKYTLDERHAARFTDEPDEFTPIGSDLYQIPTTADGWTLSKRYTRQ